MNRKTLLSKMLVVPMLALVCVTGCKTLPGDTMHRVYVAAKLAAYVGGAEYLRAHPETRPVFIIARDELKALEQAETVDLVTVLAIVQRLPVKELESPESRLIVTAATIILSDLDGFLPVEQLQHLQPLAKALREGLDLALIAP